MPPLTQHLRSTLFMQLLFTLGGSIAKSLMSFLYLVVKRMMDCAFLVWGSNCTNSADQRHFPCYSGQLSHSHAL